MIFLYERSNHHILWTEAPVNFPNPSASRMLIAQPRVMCPPCAIQPYHNSLRNNLAPPLPSRVFCASHKRNDFFRSPPAKHPSLRLYNDGTEPPIP